MNRWSLIRDNVVTALGTLHFPDYVVIGKIGRPDGIDSLVGPIAVGVSLAGDRWISQPEIGERGNLPAELLVQLTIRADSALDAVDVLDAAGMIEDISFIALKVREIDVGIYGYDDSLNTGGVFLYGVSSGFLEFKGKDPGGAGPLAKVFSMKTTVLPL
jgi:hypothetical protein